MSKEPDSREKTILAAAKLLRLRGYFGTALSDILEASGAPRGSLYFHFPNGKEEIAQAALALAAEMVRQAIAGAATTSDSAETFLVRIARGMAADLERSGFQEGCPIAPTALEVAGSADGLADTVKRAFELWEAAIRSELEKRFGFSPERASFVSAASLGQLEGALLLARSYRSVEPMRRAEDVLKLLLQ